MYCKVALLSPPYSELTYAIPSYISKDILNKGLRVAIPLGNGALRVGIIVDLMESHGLGDNVSIKEIVWLLETKPLINNEIVSLIESLSVRQAQNKAQIFANILPQALRTTAKLRLKEYKENARPVNHSFKALKSYSQSEASILFEKYINSNGVELLELQQENAEHEMCRLAMDPPWNIRPTAHKQREILEYLYANGDCTRKRLQQNLGATSLAPLSALTKLGMVNIVPCEDAEEQEEDKLLALLETTLLESKPIFEFSAEQQKAIDTGIKVLDKEKAELRLLYGITGSGKTAVYLELARQTLLRNKSVFFLAPEVALALKLKKDVEKFLPNVKIHFSHGYQTPQKRAKNYKEIASEEQACIIIGTRSALFHAVKVDIGLIVLDEEHDSSYKQDEKFFYHAKEIAWHRAMHHKSLMLIGSATPDIKTFYAVQEGQIPCDTLPARVGGGDLPQIELVDISQSSKHELLTAYTLNALKECIEKDEQAVILLNRRGYAPIMYCLDCKEVQRCPHCSIAMTYHKKRNMLTCHYCNYTRFFPSPCTKCKGLQYLPLGDGTEKLEEQLASFMQEHGFDKKILRLDRDSTRRHGSMEEILAKFSRKEASILVGTQMLSKGHHFPHVSLAIIADADLTLNFPDYRAPERTFQLLVQSAGRAGRELENGKVLIQTRDTKHYCWQYVQNHDYEKFYEYEIALRKKRQYPPFIKLALIRISFPMQMENFSEALAQVTNYLKLKSKDYNVRLLGPVASPIAIIQNVKRYQALIKSGDWKDIRQLFHSLQMTKQDNPLLKDVRFLLDIDPVNML